MGTIGPPGMTGTYQFAGSERQYRRGLTTLSRRDTFVMEGDTNALRKGTRNGTAAWRAITASARLRHSRGSPSLPLVLRTNF